jgi:hypothetical protein
VSVRFASWREKAKKIAPIDQIHPNFFIVPPYHEVDFTFHHLVLLSLAPWFDFLPPLRHFSLQPLPLMPPLVCEARMLRMSATCEKV